MTDAKRTTIRFIAAQNETIILFRKVKTMEKTLLFTRKFNGETYKFYMNKGVGCFGIYSEYVSVETPENDFGYTDTVLFNHEKAYTLNRYLQNWILKAITEALIKRGYAAYMQ